LDASWGCARWRSGRWLWGIAPSAAGAAAAAAVVAAAAAVTVAAAAVTGAPSLGPTASVGLLASAALTRFQSCAAVCAVVLAEVATLGLWTSRRGAGRGSCGRVVTALSSCLRPTAMRRAAGSARRWTRALTVLSRVAAAIKFSVRAHIGRPPGLSGPSRPWRRPEVP